MHHSETHTIAATALQGDIPVTADLKSAARPDPGPAHNSLRLLPSELWPLRRQTSAASSLDVHPRAGPKPPGSGPTKERVAAPTTGASAAPPLHRRCRTCSLVVSSAIRRSLHDGILQYM